MINGVGVLADELLDLRIGLRTGRCRQFLRTKLCQRRLRQDLAHALEAAHHAPHVVRIGEELWIDQWQGHGVTVGQ
ncbi:hypothetical protein D3C71_2001540 [compost metagenome]